MMMESPDRSLPSWATGESDVPAEALKSLQLYKKIEAEKGESYILLT
jgi:hypothetical protein